MLLTTVLIGQSFGEISPAAAPAGAPGDARRSKGATGAIMAGAITAAVAAGVGGWFLYRRALRERHNADSIIAVVEQAWDRAGALYAAEHYRDAIEKFQIITGVWYEYEHYSTRYRKKPRIPPDSIRAVIVSCDFLKSMIEPVTMLNRRAEGLPDDMSALSRFRQQELAAAKQSLRQTMDSIMAVNSNHRDALQYSFRPIERRLHIVDSLAATAYDRQKAEFTAKAEFYYNRAVAADDTSMLHEFVGNCDYFRDENEWCGRGRSVLREKTAERPAPAVPVKAMTARDSVKLAYREAMQSKNVDVLEAYIKKYSARRYRSQQRVVRIESVKAALRDLRMEIDREMAFSRLHPRFGNSADTVITITIKGLSNSTQEAFRTAWSDLRNEIVQLPAIRLPATLDIDYTSQPAMFMLNAVVSTEHDIEKSTINSRRAYYVSCLMPAMRLMQRLKLLTMVILNGKRTSERKLDDVIDYELEKVGAATYSLRLVKPGNTGIIIFYARDNKKSDGDATRLVQFYDFYDLMAAGKATKRFPIYPGSLPNVIPSLASDPVEQLMGADFFGK